MPQLPTDDIDEEIRKLSQQERAFAAEVARHTVATILDAARNQKVAAGILDAWGGQLQRVVGRAVIRVAWWLMLTLIAIGAMRYGLIGKLQELLGAKP